MIPVIKVMVFPMIKPFVEFVLKVVPIVLLTVQDLVLLVSKTPK